MHSQSQAASQLQTVNPRAGLEAMFKKEGDDNSSKFKKFVFCGDVKQTESLCLAEQYFFVTKN